MKPSFYFKLPPFLTAISLFSLTLASGEMAWEQGAPIPHGRTEVAVAALDGKVYLIGGFTITGVTRRVEMYDPAADRWTQKAPLPVALHHAGAGAVKGKLYVVGGFEGFFFWKPSRALWAYDPKTDRWEARREMPTARGALGVGVWDGRLYAVGGLGESPEGKTNVDATEVYDPSSNRWEEKGSLPKARDHLAVAVVGGGIHAIGGRLNSAFCRNLANHDVYDPKSGRWSSAAPLPKPRSGIAAAVLDGKIFVLGGEAPEGTFSDNDAYDPATDRWQSAPSLPTARHGLGAATVLNKIYVIAGGPRPGGSLSKVNEVFRLN
ncbi:MAG: Kelch repeat-containing protein [Nitrospiria bacterium]